MANRRNPRHLHLNIIFQLLALLSHSSALFSPPDNHLISCGSLTPTTLDDHRIFLPDASCLISDNPISISADANPPLQSHTYASLYKSARVFTSPSSYEFHISNKGTHIVRLHFYPFSTHSHDLASAHFHVVASGFVLLSNFTASSDSPMKEFILKADAEKLVIFFVPVDSSSFAFVNAIEVISAPADLVEDRARLVQADKVLSFDGLSKLAMEILFRINVGGPHENFDISSATVQVLASPYYVDFVADVGISDFLFVSIGPSRFVGHSRVDGLLNGLEIMKLNNTVGSLDGVLPFALVLHSSRGGFSTAIRSLICWSAFVMLSAVGFMLILRRRAESRNRIAWSPLPMDVKIAKGGQFA
ncbi:LOW QUALITY PROTEIN: probable receptor-like protein kinase At5g24010 [Phalaenopsis equestris]|uniref:LOW QUALITY PROTEIN: probable receptor-like protein kinase At5g24010 n=1 Tax=Phalaenopsis equestris TaxID=78828 RepID=UPI0009E5947C|nr:LOW QUALITY PROTEIN: probable receptor-like protein kinase At5g24010 [Phalaenopsis equestris]